MSTCRDPQRRSGAPPASSDTSDRIQRDLFGAVALACFGAVGYLLIRWWMGQ